MSRTLLFLFLFLIGLSLCTLLASAQKEQKLPADLPPYGALKPAPIPQVAASKLPNGLTVWLVRQAGVPKVSFVLAVRGGLASDPAERPAMSELLTTALTQGTKSRSAKQLAEEMQSAGGDIDSGAQRDYLTLSASVLYEKASTGLSVLADIAQNASFPDDEVALAKANESDSLRERESRPSFLARRALAKVVFGDHPYSRIAPTLDSIAATTAGDLRREYSRRFRPDQALLVVVGDLNAETMSASLQKQFGSWTATSAAPPAEVAAPSQSLTHALFLVPRAGSVQTTLMMASFGPLRRDPDYEAAEVANATYGGMFGSRLVRNIREDKGYTYSPGASLQTMRQAGLLVTRADVRNAVTGASLNEIDYELNRMSTTEVTAEELAHAKLYMVGLQAIQHQSRDAVAQELAGLWVEGLPPEEIGRFSQKVEKTTADEVNAAGKKYFSAARMTIVAVGEDKTIREQVAPLGVEVRTAP